jgi:cell division protease FtsH
MAQQKDFSEHTAQVIDSEIQRILWEGEKEAASLLKDNRRDLDRLADALIQHETLEADQIDELLKDEPSSPEQRAS